MSDPQKISKSSAPLRASASTDSIEHLRLVPRKEAARILGGVCIATIIRYEKSGLLRPVRLSPKGQVFYRALDLAQLINELSMSNGDES